MAVVWFFTLGVPQPGDSVQAMFPHELTPLDDTLTTMHGDTFRDIVRNLRRGRFAYDDGDALRAAVRRHGASGLDWPTPTGRPPHAPPQLTPGPCRAGEGNTPGPAGPQHPSGHPRATAHGPVRSPRRPTPPQAAPPTDDGHRTAADAPRGARQPLSSRRRDDPRADRPSRLAPVVQRRCQRTVRPADGPNFTRKASSVTIEITHTRREGTLIEGTSRVTDRPRSCDSRVRPDPAPGLPLEQEPRLLVPPAQPRPCHLHPLARTPRAATPRRGLRGHVDHRQRRRRSF